MRPATLTLLCIRHGQSEANAGLSTDPDSPLTPLGREQARLAGEWLQRHYGPTLTALYCSDMLRACQTADIISEGLRPVFEQAPRPLPGFREVDRWEHGYLPIFESPHHPLGATLGPEHTDYGIFRARVEQALRELIQRHPAGVVALVSHGAVMGTILRSICGAHCFSVTHENSAITKLRWYDGRWHLDYVNRHEHLIGYQGYQL
jgi:broad specificity phosphatase PhoE